MSKVEKSRQWIGGRYEVAIPWKEQFPSLPDNREEAERRLFPLEKNLLKKPEVVRRYKETMNANIEKGFIRDLARQKTVQAGTSHTFQSLGMIERPPKYA